MATEITSAITLSRTTSVANLDNNAESRLVIDSNAETGYTSSSTSDTLVVNGSSASLTASDYTIVSPQLLFRNGGSSTLTDCKLVNTGSTGGANRSYASLNTQDTGNTDVSTHTWTNVDYVYNDGAYGNTASNRTHGVAALANVADSESVTLTWDNVSFKYVSNTAAGVDDGDGGFINLSDISNTSSVNNLSLDGFSINWPNGFPATGFDWGDGDRGGYTVRLLRSGNFVTIPSALTRISSSTNRDNVNITFWTPLLNCDSSESTYQLQHTTNTWLINNTLDTNGAVDLTGTGLSNDITDEQYGLITVASGWNPVPIDSVDGTAVTDVEYHFNSSDSTGARAYQMPTSLSGSSKPAQVADGTTKPPNGFLIARATSSKGTNTLESFVPAAITTMTGTLYSYTHEDIDFTCEENSIENDLSAFTSSHTISMTADASITAPDVNTAEAIINDRTGNTGDDIYDMVKVQAYNDGVDVRGFVTVDGTTLDFGRRNIVFSGSALQPRLTLGATEVTIPVVNGSLSAGTKFDTISTSGSVTFEDSTTAGTLGIIDENSPSLSLANIGANTHVYVYQVSSLTDTVTTWGSSTDALSATQGRRLFDTSGYSSDVILDGTTANAPSDWGRGGRTTSIFVRCVAVSDRNLTKVQTFELTGGAGGTGTVTFDATLTGDAAFSAGTAQTTGYTLSTTESNSTLKMQVNTSAFNFDGGQGSASKKTMLTTKLAQGTTRNSSYADVMAANNLSEDFIKSISSNSWSVDTRYFYFKTNALNQGITINSSNIFPDGNRSISGDTSTTNVFSDDTDATVQVGSSSTTETLNVSVVAPTTGVGSDDLSATLDAQTLEVQGDLDSRLLTRANIINIGRLVPVNEEDG